jgi:tetratricopeptide (TPR) repeat protein
MRAVPRAWLAAALLAAAFPARADRLHLQGGGVIDADRFWFEGDTLMIESAGGSYGIPRSMLVRVETSTALEPKATPPPAVAAPRGAAPPRIAPEAATAMKEANAALLARDFETAARRFHDVIRLEPNAAGPRAGYAMAEMALGRDPAALPVVLDGLGLDPGSAQLHEILGDLRDRDERVDDALTSWREAFRLAPSDRVRDKIVKGERELTAARDYEFSAAAHFNLRYDGELDQDLVAALTDFLEDRFAEFSSTYRHAPSQAVTVLLYPQQAFHDVTQVGNEVAGLYDGKIRVPLGGLKSIDPEAERVLAHELTHAFVQSKTRGNCPRWLHEGLAQIAEPRTLRRAQRAELARSVRAESPGTWPDAAFSYPAALSLTRFLEERRSFDVLVAVLGRLGDGESLDAALRAFYGQTYAELAAAWAASLSTEPAP